MTEETQAIRDAAFANSAQHTAQLTELIKANEYLKNISAGVWFFVVITFLAIGLAICGGGSILTGIG